MIETPLYPLLIERQMVYRMWGGQHIASWLKLPPPHTEKIGETWEVYEGNRIRNGTLEGTSLAEATHHYQERLIGPRVKDAYGANFPLLIKFIDANDKLSIQVHPDDTYAHAHEAATGFYGKTESWYILDARPSAQVIYGVNEPMDREHFTQAIEHGTLEQFVRYLPVQRGDVVFTPPGTLHAINDGLLLFEIQQKSDLTYRVYDYGRHDPSTGELRSLHLDRALDVLRYTPSPQPKSEPIALDANKSRQLLMACQHFALELWQLVADYTMIADGMSMNILTIIEGSAALRWSGGVLDLVMGDSVVVPAQIAHWVLLPRSETFRLLRSYVPDVEQDIRAPLRAQGVDEDRIDRVVFVA